MEKNKIVLESDFVYRVIGEVIGETNFAVQIDAGRQYAQNNDTVLRIAIAIYESIECRVQDKIDCIRKLMNELDVKQARIVELESLAREYKSKYEKLIALNT